MPSRDDDASARALLDVDPLAIELGARLEAAGHVLYLVGGSVRNLIMGVEPGDLDFATDAVPEVVLRLLQGWADHRYLTGIRFGTIGAKKDGRSIEITTFRQEAYPERDRHPEVVFSSELEVDLSRRDFTVNAMAVSVPGRAFVDPFGGVRHLAAKVLDTPLDPEVAFGDDPLRMLRAARFAATLELTPAPRVVDAMRRMAGRLEIVSRERIQAELSKTLVAPRPALGLTLMVETGLAEQFLPELPALRLEQDPVHRHKDVLAHTMAVVEGCEPDLRLRLAALLHDVGKPATRAFTQEGVRFHHHEVVGARMAGERLRELRYPSEVVEDVAKLVEMHLRFHSYKDGWSDAALRRYVRDAGPLLDRLNALVRADCTTQNAAKAKALAALQDDFELRLARLAEQENLESIRPALDGNQVMEHLSIGPGRDVGDALAFLLELRMERGPMDEADALRALDEWWRGRKDADAAG
ncbi:MAG TPA: CCA tRNA nucleotidyltransferase [Actinomycetota bacterium]|jgi:poly(A) polymerase